MIRDSQQLQYELGKGKTIGACYQVDIRVVASPFHTEGILYFFVYFTEVIKRCRFVVVARLNSCRVVMYR